MKIPPRLAAPSVGFAARALAATWRWRRVARGGETRRMRPPLPMEPAVYALWHEHLLPLTMGHRGQGAVALISEHRDGEILTRVLDGFGVEAARGSSTRGGERGLRRMVRAGREDRPLAFTPDGPRGPARACKPGVVRAAAETGLSIVPLGAAASRYRRLGSWDRFLIPLPLARVYLSHGDPMEVPGSVADAWRGGELRDRSLVETWTRRVEEALEAERRRCEAAAS